MLNIKNLYKEMKNNVIKDINITIGKGSSTSIECCNEISDLLVNLILGKETPAKGEIFLEGIKNLDYLKTNSTNIAVVFRQESFYEGMTIENYLKFFSEVLHSSEDYKEIMLKLALLDIRNNKIKSLNYSQRRRLSFARERLKHPKLMIFQEPILNIDSNGAKIIVENIEELRSSGTAILITSLFFKDTLMLGQKSYTLNNDGLIEIDNINTEEGNDAEEIDYIKPVFRIEKISAKVDERILLFDPNEIDYIESEQGISYLYVRGGKFPNALSLAELEERLKYFGFFRCHRSYLVNLQRVREVITWTRNSYSLNLEDKVKSTIPLSKGRLEELKAILKL